MLPRLRTTIPGFTVTLVAALGVVVLAIGWLDGHATVVETAHEVTASVGADITARVEGRLEMPQRALLLAVELFQDGAVPLDDHGAVEAYFRDFLSIQPGVTALRVTTVTGASVEVARALDGSLSVVAVPPGTPDADVPEDDWWTYWIRPDGADPDGSGPHWGPVTERQDLRAPAVTGSLPVRSADGGVEAVVAVELSLIELSHYLASLKVGVSGHAFLTDAAGTLLASPDTATLGGEDEALFQLQEAAFAGRPEARAFHALPEVQAAYAASGAGRFRFKVDGAWYLAALSPVDGALDEPWFVGVIVPEDDFLGQLKHMLRMGVLALLFAIAVGLVAGNVLSRSLASSLDDVTKETRSLARLDFGPSIERDSRFQEVHDVLVAFEAMKAGLRSFARYVPVQVVRRLVERGIDAEPGGEVREVTVMFSDIENFTTISESLEPGELAGELSAYFSVLTDIVQSPESGGVVDKYVGDALMAFWGAPENVPDHAARACAAALQCAQALASAPTGVARFRTRIGLHTDRVMVGNVGAPDRLGYTAIGDGVNVASRVEGLNKEYGTSILVTEETKAAAGDAFTFRHMGSAHVKGRTEPVVLYELVGYAPGGDSPKAPR